MKRPKLGRPPGPPEEVRARHTRVPVSEAEGAALDAWAAREDRPLAALVWQACTGVVQVTRGPSHAWCSGWANSDGSCATCGAWPTAAVERIAALEARLAGWAASAAEALALCEAVERMRCPINDVATDGEVLALLRALAALPVLGEDRT